MINEPEEDAPMFDFVRSLVWDLLAIIGVAATVIALSFWAGWEWYHHTLKAEQQNVKVQDCGSCKKGENK